MSFPPILPNAIDCTVVLWTTAGNVVKIAGPDTVLNRTQNGCSVWVQRRYNWAANASNSCGFSNFTLDPSIVHTIELVDLTRT